MECELTRAAVDGIIELLKKQPWEEVEQAIVLFRALKEPYIVKRELVINILTYLVKTYPYIRSYLLLNSCLANVVETEDMDNI